MNDTCSYCPTCGDFLENLPVLDIYACAYSCTNGHKFLQYKKQVLSLMSAQINDIDIENDSTDDDLSIIKCWLTNDNRRSRLNGQLAEMLQNIYWHYVSDSHVIPNSNPFSFCPVCKNKLINYEQDDIWVQGKKCDHGHEFYERGGMLDYTFEGVRTHLVRAMPDNNLSFLLERWLTDNSRLSAQLHPQIRRVFENYKR